MVKIERRFVYKDLSHSVMTHNDVYSFLRWVIEKAQTSISPCIQRIKEAEPDVVCDIIVAVQENHKKEGVHIHIALHTVRASRHTAIARIRNVFPEFEGRQCHIGFQKSWAKTVDYLFKENPSEPFFDGCSREELDLLFKLGCNECNSSPSTKSWTSSDLLKLLLGLSSDDSSPSTLSSSTNIFLKSSMSHPVLAFDIMSSLLLNPLNTHPLIRLSCSSPSALMRKTKMNCSKAFILTGANAYINQLKRPSKGSLSTEISSLLTESRLVKTEDSTYFTLRLFLSKRSPLTLTKYNFKRLGKTCIS